MKNRTTRLALCAATVLMIALASFSDWHPFTSSNDRGATAFDVGSQTQTNLAATINMQTDHAMPTDHSALLPYDEGANEAFLSWNQTVSANARTDQTTSGANAVFTVMKIGSGPCCNCHFAQSSKLAVSLTATTPAVMPWKKSHAIPVQIAGHTWTATDAGANSSTCAITQTDQGCAYDQSDGASVFATSNSSGAISSSGAMAAIVYNQNSSGIASSGDYDDGAITGFSQANAANSSTYCSAGYYANYSTASDMNIGADYGQSMAVTNSTGGAKIYTTSVGKAETNFHPMASIGAAG